MQVTQDFIKPIAGGGLGDCKVGIMELSGTYATNGFDSGLKEEPMFMSVNGATQAVYASGKIKLMVPTFSTDQVEMAELADGSSVTGIKILFVIKGSF